MGRTTNINRHNNYKTWADRQAATDDVLADTPDAVTGFTATQTGATTMDLAWTNPAGQATALLELERAAAAGAGGAVANTFTDIGDLVNVTDHGWLNGQRVMFDTVVTTTGVVINTSYYIINKTDNSFQVALTPGGDAIALTTDGSGTVFVPTFAHAFIAYVDAADAAYSDTGLTTDTEYEYRATVIRRTDQTAALPLAFDTTA